MVKENSEKDEECPLTSGLSENKLRRNFRLGDITWVKHSASWWPAQVIDEAFIIGKPKKKTKHDALVRLYGTCQYLYVDPWKSNAEFEMKLKQENRSALEVFHEVLEKELSHVNLPSDYDEEAVCSKAKTSSKKVRKREGLKRSGGRVVKGSATTEGLHDETEQQYGAGQEQEIGSIATAAVAVPKGTSVCGKKGRKTAIGETSVAREGSRRSARSNAKGYVDAAEDNTSQLSNASEYGADVWTRTTENQNQQKDDSMVQETLAPDAEIRGMVRDMLFSDIISRQHDAEMAYVDDVINGICGATWENMSGCGAATTGDGRGIKRNGNRVEDDSCNVAQKARKGEVDRLTGSPSKATENVMQVKKQENTPSRDAATAGQGQLSARQIKIMQSLALIAPSGSPFGKNGSVAATYP